jgi:hypothetical protein
VLHLAPTLLLCVHTFRCYDLDFVKNVQLFRSSAILSSASHGLLTASYSLPYAGQSHYRSEWGRYVRGVDAILFVVDTASEERIGEARRALHTLLESLTPPHNNTPLCIVANKIDLVPHLSESQLIDALNLDYIMDYSLG